MFLLPRGNRVSTAYLFLGRSQSTIIFEISSSCFIEFFSRISALHDLSYQCSLFPPQPISSWAVVLETLLVVFFTLSSNVSSLAFLLSHTLNLYWAVHVHLLQPSWSPCGSCSIFSLGLCSPSSISISVHIHASHWRVRVPMLLAFWLTRVLQLTSHWWNQPHFATSYLSE